MRPGLPSISPYFFLSVPKAFRHIKKFSDRRNSSPVCADRAESPFPLRKGLTGIKFFPYGTRGARLHAVCPVRESLPCFPYSVPRRIFSVTERNFCRNAPLPRDISVCIFWHSISAFCNRVPAVYGGGTVLYTENAGNRKGRNKFPERRKPQ